MQNISTLIKEAKPLYFARKKRKKQIFSVAVMLVCVAFISVMMPKKYQVDDMYYWDLGIEQPVNEQSYIENLGFPVDDYGLLLVS